MLSEEKTTKRHLIILAVALNNELGGDSANITMNISDIAIDTEIKQE